MGRQCQTNNFLFLALFQNISPYCLLCFDLTCVELANHESSAVSKGFLSHLLIAECDIVVQLSVRSSVRPATIHVEVLFSVAVIAGSMKPCIVIVLDTLLKHIS